LRRRRRSGLDSIRKRGFREESMARRRAVERFRRGGELEMLVIR
jgi:hypothetical protein